MRFAVVPTHSRGVRRSRAEIKAETPRVGNLLIADWGAGNSAGRAIRYARLAHAGASTNADLMLPLMDVSLVRMANSGLLLAGYEIAVINGAATEFVQGWWAKYAGGES